MISNLDWSCQIIFMSLLSRLSLLSLISLLLLLHIVSTLVTTVTIDMPFPTKTILIPITIVYTVSTILTVTLFTDKQTDKHKNIETSRL